MTKVTKKPDHFERNGDDTTAIVATVPEAYNALVCRELKYAMEAAGSTLVPHYVGILMCPNGRFLECINCRLRIVFPEGAPFDTISKQFASHPCSSAFPSKPPAQGQ
jgi:hypothetical protein